jgi:hypothetical protein
MVFGFQGHEWRAPDVSGWSGSAASFQPATLG